MAMLPYFNTKTCSSDVQIQKLACLLWRYRMTAFSSFHSRWQSQRMMRSHFWSVAGMRDRVCRLWLTSWTWSRACSVAMNTGNQTFPKSEWVIAFFCFPRTIGSQFLLHIFLLLYVLNFVDYRLLEFELMNLACSLLKNLEKLHVHTLN